MKLICLAGFARVGKDTVGTFLSEEFGYQRVAIADPLKEAVQRKFQLSSAQIDGSEKDEVDPRWDRSPRQLFVEEGQLWRSRDPLMVVQAWADRVRFLSADSHLGVVCPDVRRIIEYDYARSVGASIWIVRRPGFDEIGRGQPEQQDNQVAHLADTCFDAVIDNNHEPEELHAVVREWLMGK